MSSIRSIPYQLLIGCTDFTGIIPPERIFQQSAVGADPTQIGVSGKDGPFALLSMFGPFPGLRRTSVQSAEIRITVHDQPGDYGNHDTCLEAARKCFESSPGTWVNGFWVVDFYWTDTGDDFLDDGFGTIIKTGSYHLVANAEKLR